jgi:4-hydroxy-tetrahydrodipicolinate reductase
MNILLSGCSGAMGKMLIEVIGNDPELQIVAGYDAKPCNELDFPVYQNLSLCKEDVDVIIDFSHFLAFDGIMTYASDNKIPLVIATTGLSDEDNLRIKNASNFFPVFQTANMSLGINIMKELAQIAAAIFESGFDIEIIEKHHNKKADSPSGTALMLANGINNSLQNKKEYIYGREGRNCKRTKNEMGIHAIRGGTIAGEHSIIFAGNDEIIELKHTATSKKVFANGAVKAAKYLVQQKPGLYDMKKLIKDQI